MCRSYVHGSCALTTRGPRWSGDGVAMAACDEPAASGVALPASVAVVWTSLGPLPRWVPGPTTRWAPGTTRLALHGT
jgi:hypothetical protein